MEQRWESFRVRKRLLEDDNSGKWPGGKEALASAVMGATTRRSGVKELSSAPSFLSTTYILLLITLPPTPLLESNDTRRGYTPHTHPGLWLLKAVIDTRVTQEGRRKRSSGDTYSKTDTCWLPSPPPPHPFCCRQRVHTPPPQQRVPHISNLFSIIRHIYTLLYHRQKTILYPLYSLWSQRDLQRRDIISCHWHFPRSVAEHFNDSQNLY